MFICNKNMLKPDGGLQKFFFYRTQVSLVRSMGPVSVTEWVQHLFEDLTDVTLVDEDIGQ